MIIRLLYLDIVNDNLEASWMQLTRYCTDQIIRII